MLELYYFPNATCGVKARLALHEKRVPFARRVLDRDRGDLNSPAYRTLNPNGVVPTLVHDGTVLIESTIIMTYVDDAFPGPDLAPDTPLGRADMAMWLKLVDEKYFPALAALTYATSLRSRLLERYRTDEEIEAYLGKMANEEERNRRRAVLKEGPGSEEARKAFLVLFEMIARMERSLAETAFLCADHYTLADAAVTPFLSRLDLLDMSALWNGPHPKTAEWWERMTARASFQCEALTDITDAYRRFYREEGRKAWPVLRESLDTDLH